MKKLIVNTLLIILAVYMFFMLITPVCNCTLKTQLEISDFEFKGKDGKQSEKVFKGSLGACEYGLCRGQAEYETYIIQPGDTLWEICEEKFPDEDPRKVIYEIKKINGLGTSEIRAFQKIEVPKEI